MDGAPRSCSNSHPMTQFLPADGRADAGAPLHVDHAPATRPAAPPSPPPMPTPAPTAPVGERPDGVAPTDRPVLRLVVREARPVAASERAAPDELPWGQEARRAGDREVVRRVHDEHTGNDWRVFERDARRVPGASGERCLYFDADGIVRRVWSYPDDWHALSPHELLELMERPPTPG